VNGISLFAGIGGLDLGLKMAIPDYRTVCYVEIDRYCQGVLISRMHDGGLDPAPVWDDITTFDGRPWHGRVDIISGGFPCQDISSAGKGEGIVDGNRSGLWFEYKRIIRDVRPRFAFVENVPRIFSNNRGRDFGRVVGDLAELGYDSEWCCIPASCVGAPFKGERVFILASNVYDRRRGANRDGNGEERKDEGLRPSIWVDKTRNSGEDVGKIDSGRLRNETSAGAWESGVVVKRRVVNPTIRMLAHGIQNRVDRIKCLGNAVVPQQAAKAWEILSERKR
jgi:DNA (cytosine-5)-methyltransferase 1